MTTNHQFDLYEQIEDLEDMPQIRNVPLEQLRKRKSHKKKSLTNMDAVLLEELENQENNFNFTYSAAKHEKVWLQDSLQDFYRQRWFEDILRLITGGGKEASVYQCRARDSVKYPYIAAKVYRPRMFRQLRNDSLYREGRMHLDDEGHEIKDDRALHAIQKRTNYGKRLLHTSWIGHEYETMLMLHKAGADIPEPLASGNNAILMAYIGWDDMAAPTLNTIKLDLGEARQLFNQTIQNVEIMLANNRVHGDLSAYNILYRDGEITLIDFPQALDPRENRNAYLIFKRDIKRVCDYFNLQGLNCHFKEIAESLWQNHGYSIKPSIDPRLLDDDESVW